MVTKRVELIEGQRYRVTPVRYGNSLYWRLTKVQLRYGGIENRYKPFEIVFIPEINSRGQRFLGVWFMPVTKTKA